VAAREAEIEAYALTALRAWVAGDVKAMKKLATRELLVMVGSTPPQLLDRPSFLAAMDKSFACTRFTLREVIARQHGDAAWFCAGAELELLVGGRPLNGAFLVAAMFRTGTWSSKMKLTELSLARLDPDADLAPALTRLQLWKKA
jgi:hypothetical protein